MNSIRISGQSLANMNADWKLIAITTLVLLISPEGRGTLNENQLQASHVHPQHTSGHQQQEHNSTHKCVFEVPSVSLKAYPHATVIRMGSSTHLTVIETCCAGYRIHKLQDVASTTTCLPNCENCSNGYCLQPDECECFDGFVKNDNGDCVFMCPVSCLNGRCYLDGTCKCDQGYKLDETKKFCRPICSEGCQGWRQNCTAPETCGCRKGYTLKEKGCQPICDPDCGLGGICAESNVCICRTNFTLKNGVCQASCYQKCDNGICFSSNRCLCFAGFKYHEKTSTCIPV